MKRLTIEEFSAFSTNASQEDYLRKDYKKYYSKLTDEQLKRILFLRENTGKTVFYLQGKKWIKMIIMHIDTTHKKTHERYWGPPFCIRLNYHDYLINKKREWEGFWTWNVDKIKFEDELL